jgi:hypothetical protein
MSNLVASHDVISTLENGCYHVNGRLGVCRDCSRDIAVYVRRMAAYPYMEPVKEKSDD